jgi:hypothetical protein
MAERAKYKGFWLLMLATTACGYHPGAVGRKKTHHNKEII